MTRIALVALVLGSSLLVAASVLDSRATADLNALRSDLAAEGGGVLFVRNPADCLVTQGVVVRLAEMLTERGVEVRGAVVRRGARVHEALTMANEAFLHRSISARATTHLYHMGHHRTPIALLVSASGTTIASVPLSEEIGLENVLKLLIEGGNL